MMRSIAFWLRVILLGAVVAAAGLAIGWALDGPRQAVAQEDPAALEATGRKAVEAWVGAVVSGDIEKVRQVLAPEFQIVRSDGTAYNAEAYLQSDLPQFTAMPEIKNLVVTGSGDIMVARYVLPIGPRLGADQQQTEGPRLTVFRNQGNTWLVVAHANFAAFVR